jgi:hypothetical protein
MRSTSRHCHHPLRRGIAADHTRSFTSSNCLPGTAPPGSDPISWEVNHDSKILSRSVLAIVSEICTNPRGEYSGNTFHVAIDYDFVVIGNRSIVKMAEAVTGIDIY